MPLIRTATLETLANLASQGAIGLLTQEMANPTGYGRIVRNLDGNVAAIVEEKDATPAELNINEINTGIYVLPYAQLASWLGNLKPNNQQQEYYLTDIVALAVKERVNVVAEIAEDEWQVEWDRSGLQREGVNATTGY